MAIRSRFRRPTSWRKGYRQFSNFSAGCRTIRRCSEAPVRLARAPLPPVRIVVALVPFGVAVDHRLDIADAEVVQGRSIDCIQKPHGLAPGAPGEEASRHALQRAEAPQLHFRPPGEG